MVQGRAILTIADG